MKFHVEFGPDAHEFEAASAADAWILFCSITPVARKHPNLYPRTITAVEPARVALREIDKPGSNSLVPTMTISDDPGSHGDIQSLKQDESEPSKPIAAPEDFEPESPGPTSDSIMASVS